MTSTLKTVTRCLIRSGISTGILCMSVSCTEKPKDNTVDSGSGGGGKGVIPLINAPSVVLDDGRLVTVTELVHPIEYDSPKDSVKIPDDGDGFINK